MRNDISTDARTRVSFTVIPPDLPARGGPSVVASCVQRGPIRFTDRVTDVFRVWDDDWENPYSFGAAPDSVSLWVPGAPTPTWVDAEGWTHGGRVLPGRVALASEEIFPESWVAGSTLLHCATAGVGWHRIDPAEALRALLSWDGSTAATLDFVDRFGLLPSTDRLPLDPVYPDGGWVQPIELLVASPEFDLADALASGASTLTVQWVSVHDLAEQSWLLATYQRAAQVAQSLLADPVISLAPRTWDDMGTETPSYSTDIADTRIPPAVRSSLLDDQLSGLGRRSCVNDLGHYLAERLVHPASRPVMFTVDEPSEHPAVAEHNEVTVRRMLSDTGRSETPVQPGTFDYDTEPDAGRAWAAICRHLLHLFSSASASCGHCGAPFPVTRKGRRYCTAQCSNAARQARHRARRRPRSD